LQCSLLRVSARCTEASKGVRPASRNSWLTLPLPRMRLVLLLRQAQSGRSETRSVSPSYLYCDLYPLSCHGNMAILTDLLRWLPFLLLLLFFFFFPASSSRVKFVFGISSFIGHQWCPMLLHIHWNWCPINDINFTYKTCPWQLFLIMDNSFIYLYHPLTTPKNNLNEIRPIPEHNPWWIIVLWDYNPSFVFFKKFGCAAVQCMGCCTTNIRSPCPTCQGNGDLLDYDGSPFRRSRRRNRASRIHN